MVQLQCDLMKGLSRYMNDNLTDAALRLVSRLSRYGVLAAAEAFSKQFPRNVVTCLCACFGDVTLVQKKLFVRRCCIIGATLQYFVDHSWFCRGSLPAHVRKTALLNSEGFFGGGVCLYEKACILQFECVSPTYSTLPATTWR